MISVMAISGELPVHHHLFAYEKRSVHMEESESVNMVYNFT
jgi:hypothetical protein